MVSVAIKLVKRETSQGTNGEMLESNPTKFDLFADLVNPARGFRTYEAQTQLGQVKSFRVRFRDTITPNGDWKIEFRGKEWTIQSIEPEQDRLFFWIITASHK